MSENKTKNESLIPNKQIEEMFLRVANEEEIETYLNLCRRKFKALATSYASRKVNESFFIMVEDLEMRGLSVEDLAPKKKAFDELVVPGVAELRTTKTFRPIPDQDFIRPRSRRKNA